MNETTEVIYESWVNGQKKQALQQLSETEQYFDTIEGIRHSEVITDEDKLDMLSYFLKYRD